ncbi:MAG: ABC transporter permease [Acidimicrobiales bacterium]
MTAIVAPVPLAPSRLRFGDALATGTLGLRGKRARALLTALGIAIGIAAMVSVVGISASSRADLLAQLDELGTNLLQVTPGRSVFGDDSSLPTTAPSMVRRVAPVTAAASTTNVSATVRRTDKISRRETGGIAVIAAEGELASVLDATVAEGRFLDDAMSSFPTVVLGSVAAERLGITSLEGSPRVWLGEQWFTVIGILDPIPLAPDIDRAALIGYDIAAERFDTDRAATAIWVRADDDQVASVRDVLPATANPEHPEEVTVTRPSDALEAEAKADDALTALLLGLGGVALLVGGIGIANVMVISVLERRTEIGLRRALGATRRHVRAQFVVEAVALAAIGGIAGIALGTVVTAGYAANRGWLLAVPIPALAGGVLVALVVGAVAGLYPASRAARLAPAEAVRPA